MTQTYCTAFHPELQDKEKVLESEISARKSKVQELEETSLQLTDMKM